MHPGYTKETICHKLRWSWDDDDDVPECPGQGMSSSPWSLHTGWCHLSWSALDNRGSYSWHVCSLWGPEYNWAGCESGDKMGSTGQVLIRVSSSHRSLIGWHQPKLTPDWLHWPIPGHCNMAPAPTFWRWPLMMAPLPSLTGQFRAQVKLRLASDGCAIVNWPILSRNIFYSWPHFQQPHVIRDERELEGAGTGVTSFYPGQIRWAVTRPGAAVELSQGDL